MRNERLAAAFSLFIAVVVTSATPLFAQVVQRSLHVSVMDSSGRVVPNLGPSDFFVREDNVSREVLRVAPASDPMQIALLLDDSQASSDFLIDYREALQAFITAMTSTEARGEKGNSLALVTLAARPTISVNYTTDRGVLLKGAGRVFPQQDSGTTLLDGIFEVSEGMVKRGSSRPVIVAITTEGPEVSNRSYLQVLDMLGESGAILHIIAVGPMSNRSTDRARVIDEGTESSGGSYDNLLSSRGLTPRLKQLATELSQQYLVTYAHPASLIPPDKITVSAAKPGLTARGRIVKDEIEERR